MRCAARDNSKPSGLMVERHAEIAEDESETVRYYLHGIANLIAYPIIYLAMDRWLQHFAYRIELSATPFALGSLLTLGIALLTISTQAWKAARTNPVETLRYE